MRVLEGVGGPLGGAHPLANRESRPLGRSTATRTPNAGACTIDAQAVGNDPGEMRSSAAPSDVGSSVSRPELPSGLRGWLVVYLVGLAIQAVPALGLSVGAVVIFADPARAGLTSFVPLGALLFYVTTNIVLAVYTAVVLSLMIRRRRAGIVNAIVLNCFAVLFLTLWHLFGEKSPVGTIVDSLPGLIGIAYILRSRRVHRTFVASRGGAPSLSSEPSR